MPRDFSRKTRVQAELHRELAELVRDELTDPRVATVTVTRVDISPDLRNARVLVSLLGDDRQLADAVGVLNRAAGRLRRSLGARLRLRVTPNLRFAPDEQLREADRVSGLIRAAVETDEAIRAGRDGGGDAHPADRSRDEE